MAAGSATTLKCVIVVEARMTSSRLPGKVLLPAGGKPLLQNLIERLKRVRGADDIVVATTENSTDDPLAVLCGRLGVKVFRGSEDDVLGRVCGALRSVDAGICVEITADCPLMDPQIVDETIAEYRRTMAEHPYVGNVGPGRSVPDGFDVQVFSAQALYQLADESRDPLDREHVSYGFYRPESGNRWKPRFIQHEACRGAEDLIVTLDYREDYELIRSIHEELGPQHAFYGVREVVQWIRAHPDLEERCRRVRQKGR